MKYKKTIPKPIGVIGGMGSQASSELYRLLIEGARRNYDVLAKTLLKQYYYRKEIM